jgi:predicted metal-dependent hydrolase
LSIAVDPDLHLRAVGHFNRADFFEAHEVWEDAWREAFPPEKQVLQGLIQVAVALHHHSTGNIAGTRSLLPRACRNLSICPGDFHGIAITKLLRSLQVWQEALSAGTPVPPLPQI